MYDHKSKELNRKMELEMMLAKTITMFKYEGLPKTIPHKDFEKQLQTNGFAYVTEVNGKLYSFSGGLGGEPDPYGNPTKIVIANPSLRYNATLEIDDDGVMVNNDSLKNGLKYILEKYIYLMSENEITMIINGFNNRIPVLISAGDDATKESAELYLRKVVDGEIGVVAENRLFEGIKAHATGSPAGAYTQLIEYQQYLKGSLYNELGLEMNYNMKRERLTQGEVEMTDTIYPFIDNMLMNRQKAVEAINEKYGTEITVDFDSAWKKRDEPVVDTPEENGYDAVVVESTPLDDVSHDAPRGASLWEETPANDEIVEELVEELEDAIEELKDEVEEEGDTDVKVEQLSDDVVDEIVDEVVEEVLSEIVEDSPTDADDEEDEDK